MLRQLQASVGDWHLANWPDTDPALDRMKRAAKIAEEAGEVCAAVIKAKPVEDLELELADVIITACALAEHAGIDLERVTWRHWWDDVRPRRYESQPA